MSFTAIVYSQQTLNQGPGKGFLTFNSVAKFSILEACGGPDVSASFQLFSPKYVEMWWWYKYLEKDSGWVNSRKLKWNSRIIQKFIEQLFYQTHSRNWKLYENSLNLIWFLWVHRVWENTALTLWFEDAHILLFRNQKLPNCLRLLSG